MLGCRANLRCSLGECNCFVFHMWAKQDLRNGSITSVVYITCFVSMWSNPPMVSLYCALTMLYATHLFSSIVSGQDRQKPILRWEMLRKQNSPFKELLSLCSLGQQQWALFLYTLANFYSLYKLAFTVQLIYYSTCKPFWGIWGWVTVQYNVSQLN